jgi:hypothetical protein
MSTLRASQATPSYTLYLNVDGRGQTHCSAQSAHTNAYIPSHTHTYTFTHTCTHARAHTRTHTYNTHAHPRECLQFYCEEALATQNYPLSPLALTRAHTHTTHTHTLVNACSSTVRRLWQPRTTLCPRCPHTTFLTMLLCSPLR